MAVLEEDKILIVINELDFDRKRSNLVFVDLESGKKIKEVRAPAADVFFGHCTAMNKDMVVISAQERKFNHPSEGERVLRLTIAEKDYKKQQELLEKLLSNQSILPRDVYVAGLDSELFSVDSAAYQHLSLGAFGVASSKSFVAVTYGLSESIGFFDLEKKKLIHFFHSSSVHGVSSVSPLACGDFVAAANDLLMRFHAPDFKKVSKINLPSKGPSHSIVV